MFENVSREFYNIWQRTDVQGNPIGKQKKNLVKPTYQYSANFWNKLVKIISEQSSISE